MKYFYASLTLMTCYLVQAQTLTIGDVNPHTVDVRAFNLSQSTDVEITGTGGIFRDDYKLLVYYGWILDSKTRKVVWHAYDDIRDKEDLEDRQGKFELNDDIRLPAGNYELYFTGAHHNYGWGGEWGLEDLGDLLEEIFDSRSKENFRRTLQDDLFIQVRGDGLREVAVSDLMESQLKDAIAYFVRAEDSELFEQGFSISRPTNIRIYSIGEGRKDNTFDFVRIVDANSQERVFEMNYRNTRFAGGADKNIKLDETIELPAGSYIVSYRTDDSHSYKYWNAMPPDDPQFWGVAVFPATSVDKQNVIPYTAPKTLEPIVELTRVRNYELVSTGFELKKDMDLRVLCIGERDGSDDMADFGWIVDADTRETVWKMRAYRSEHAGGADKNRVVQDKIELPAGKYIAYYRTDGSHAYNSWNSSRPEDETHWGITLWAVDESDMGAVAYFDEDSYTAENVVVDINMITDRDYRREHFSLENTTKVTILAMGEGSDGRMNDTAWIKNMDTGRIVWEMDYYDTEHAGGARKNRRITETITLPSGEYNVYYESDGSHSFTRWNAPPPDDPQSYGVRILVTE